MKLIKYLASILFLCVLLSFAQVSVSALRVDDMYSSEYLLNHGHSPEIVRMIELQNSRIASNKEDKEKNNRFVKFLKNLYYERDCTMPLNDFGYDQIYTPEAHSKPLLPKTLFDRK